MTEEILERSEAAYTNMTKPELVVHLNKIRAIGHKHDAGSPVRDNIDALEALAVYVLDFNFPAYPEVTWDWKSQPDWDEINSLLPLGVSIVPVESGGDQYAVEVRSSF